MKKLSKPLLLEQLHHDNVARYYSLRRKSDYIWEIPESIYLLRKKYFSKNYVVIDMGCGPAESIKNIISKPVLTSFKYIGVDISPKMLNYAKKNIPTGKYICGDIETIQFPNNYADVILSLGALHHSIHQIKTLKNWSNILKTNGYLLMREPTYEALKKGQGESPMEEGVKWKDLSEFLIENNFEIISVVFFSSKAFHFFNKVMIKIGLGGWKYFKFLWYPVQIIDVFFIKLLNANSSTFRGLAFTLVARKK